jgi:hypothetical protein
MRLSLVCLSLRDVVQANHTHKLGEQDLQLYGSTSIFQYAPQDPDRRSRFPEIIEKTSQCYVLLVEGVDDSAYNPDFDWSRHLPPEVPIDRREHDRYVYGQLSHTKQPTYPTTPVFLISFSNSLYPGAYESSLPCSFGTCGGHLAFHNLKSLRRLHIILQCFIMHSSPSPQPSLITRVSAISSPVNTSHSSQRATSIKSARVPPSASCMRCRSWEASMLPKETRLWGTCTSVSRTFTI